MRGFGLFRGGGRGNAYHWPPSLGETHITSDMCSGTHISPTNQQYSLRAHIAKDGSRVWPMCQKTSSPSYILAPISKVKCSSNTEIGITNLRPLDETIFW